MPDVALELPCRRPELAIVPGGEAGRYVVKDPSAGAYFQIEEEEQFLLTQMDGTRNAEVLCAAFAGRFGQALAPQLQPPDQVDQ
ncbi:MAG: hypothetical protein ACOX1P_07360 [Thermoguttaceae bacterium]|jgi:hypothetical protein